LAPRGEVNGLGEPKACFPGDKTIMLRRHFLLVISFLCLVGAQGCSPSAQPLQSEMEYWPVSDFSLTDQDGHTVQRKDLLGNVWVTSFIFTRCATFCPQVTATLAQLQSEFINREGLLFVSISVDPEHDTPAVLKEYATKFGADPKRWMFLTGEQEKVYRLIQEGFKDTALQNQGQARTPGNEVTHSSRLFLIDRKGKIRGYFEGRQVDDKGNNIGELPRLKQKLADLLGEQP
jgi:protein SCO1